MLSISFGESVLPVRQQRSLYDGYSLKLKPDVVDAEVVADASVKLDEEAPSEANAQLDDEAPSEVEADVQLDDEAPHEGVS